MKYYRSFLCLCLAFAWNNSFAQHDHGATAQVAQLQFAGVLSTFLSDPELSKFQLQSSLMTVAPSLVDTVSHRHDADLFGYVIDGTVEIGLEHQSPTIFKAGQMFHEKRNVLHSLVRNPDNKTPAHVLLVFIIKEGRKGYTRAYGDGR